MQRAIDLGYDALAVTDHDGFYGLVKFWSAAVKAGAAGGHMELELIAPTIRSERGVVMIGRSRQSRVSDTAKKLSLCQGQSRQGDGGEGGFVRSAWNQGRRFGTESDHLVVLAPSPDGYAQLSSSDLPRRRCVVRKTTSGVLDGRTWRSAATKGMTWWP